MERESSKNDFFERAVGAHLPFTTVFYNCSEEEAAARQATPSGSVIFIGKIPMPTL